MAQFDMVRRNGDPVSVEVAEASYKQGESVWIVAIIRDITPRKEAEEKLRQSEELWSYALEATSDGVWDWNLITGEVRFSKNWQRLLGFEEAVMPHSLDEWEKRIFPEDLAQANAEMTAYLEGRTNVYRSEQRLNAADGSVRWILDRGMIVSRDATGKPSRMIGTITDITAQKANEQQIVNLNQNLENLVMERTAQLKTVNKELEAFSYSVSHDLRSPLRGIDGWSQAVLEDYGDALDARAKEYLTRIRFDVARMGQLIDGLLRLAQVSRTGLKMRVVNLSELATGISLRLQEEYFDKPMEFVIQPGLTTACDAELIEIALTNLLSNAAKFSAKRENPKIEFGANTVKNRKAYYVRDNGAGFDMAYAKKLFGAFQRMHKASEFPGTGIGLATVQRIIHSHHGEIWAESAVDEGSTFYFSVGYFFDA